MSDLIIPTPSSDDEIKTLMKNIHDGISKFSLPKLNSILKNIIRKPMKTNNVDFVLKLVSVKFNITKEELINTKLRGKKASPKMIVCVLLHRIDGQSIKSVSNLFKNFPNATTFALKTFDNITSSNSADGKLLMKQYKTCEEKFIEYLNSQDLK